KPVSPIGKRSPSRIPRPGEQLLQEPIGRWANFGPLPNFDRRLKKLLLIRCCQGCRRGGKGRSAATGRRNGLTVVVFIKQEVTRIVCRPHGKSISNAVDSAPGVGVGRGGCHLPHVMEKRDYHGSGRSRWCAEGKSTPKRPVAITEEDTD